MNFHSNHYLHIEGLLSSDELTRLRDLISKADFQDGVVSASDAASKVKKNLQIRPEDSVEAQQASAILMQAFSRNVTLQSSIMPKAILPPLLSKYEEDMTYGLHVDSPLMGTQFTIRTDVGMTLFLSEPDSYDGGELQVITEAGDRLFKLPAGDAVIYPTTKLHQVLPVKSGVRLAAVTWMQCAVRDPENRSILNTLRKSAESVSRHGLDNEHLALQQLYANLLRRWAEL